MFSLDSRTVEARPNYPAILNDYTSPSLGIYRIIEDKHRPFLEEKNCIFDETDLEMDQPVGEGNYGIVFKGLLSIQRQDAVVPVAAKCLKCKPIEQPRIIATQRLITFTV